MNIEKKIGNCIRQVRKERGLSQEQLADLVGIHRTYIGMVERGEKNITINSLNKITTKLDVKIWYLLKKENI